MAIDLQNKPIIITGASSGIGAATAIECAKRGMPVLLNARREDRLKQVVKVIRDSGGGAEMVVGDVAEEGVNTLLLDTAEELFADQGGVYAVFANAGYGLNRTMLEMTMPDLRDIFEVNFFAACDLLMKAGTRMREQTSSGHLLMCSSCLSKFSLTNHGAYAATKAAQNQVCRSMRMELRDEGIAVSSVHPITTTTEFFDVSAERSGSGFSGDLIAKNTPRWFLHTPQRVARSVVKCLQKPKAEVWPSVLTRFFAGGVTAFPQIVDWMVRLKKIKKAIGQ